MIEWTVPQPGDVPSAALINTTLTAIGTATDALVNDNLRLGGLDERSIAESACHQRLFDPVEIDASDTFTNTSYATPSISGTDLKSGSFTIPTRGQALLFAAIQCPTTPGGPDGIPADRYVEAVLVVKDSGLGSETELSSSAKWVGRADDPSHGSIFLVAALTGSSNYSTFDYACVQTKLTGGAGTYVLANATLVGILLPAAE